MLLLKANYYEKKVEFFKNKFQSLFFQNILVSQSQNLTRESHPSWTVGIKNYSDKNWMLDWILMP